MNKKRLLAMALLAGVFSCGFFRMANAAPNSQRPPAASDRILNQNRNLPQTRKVLGGDPIPLMTDMMNYARTGTIGSGARAAVYATVVISSAGSGFKAGSSRTSYANGVLTVAGPKGDEYFEGSFSLAQNSGDASTPFRGASGTVLKARIYQNGRVNLTTSVPVKNTSSSMTFTSDGADGFLWGRVTGGTTQLVSIALSKGTASSGLSAPSPSKPPQSNKPRGMKLRVGGEIRITNSEDGVADNDVEMFGNVAFNGQERWNVRRSSARTHKKGDVIPLDYMTIDVYFDNASTALLKVTGSLRDRDINNGDVVIRGDDSMWNTTRDNVINVDLKQLVESQRSSVTLQGDNDSESANVVVIVRKIADIY